MSSILKDGWGVHAQPYDTDPVATALYYFGIPIETKDAPVDFPLEKKVVEKEIYGDYEPSCEVFILPGDKVGVRFMPVNGIFLHWFFGKVTAGAGTLKTITVMDGTVRIPRIWIFHQTGTKKYHNYATVFEDLILDMEKNQLAVSMIGKCQKHGADSRTPTFTYPADITPTEIKTMFNQLDYIQWNSGDLYLAGKFQGNFRRVLKGYPDNNGEYYQEISESSTVHGIYTIQFHTVSGELIMDDYLAGTSRLFAFKYTKQDDPTKYITFSHNAFIASLMPLRIKGEPTLYTAVIVCDDYSFPVDDKLEDALYPGIV